MNTDRRLDWTDFAMICGIGLLGYCVLTAFGQLALIAFVGALLLTLGGLVSWRQQRNSRRGN